MKEYFIFKKEIVISSVVIIKIDFFHVIHPMLNIFKNYDIEYVHSPVVIDGLIITATGPESATQFGIQSANLIKKIHPNNIS